MSSRVLTNLTRRELSPLLELNYNNTIADAFADLGKPDQVRRVSSISKSICLLLECIRSGRAVPET
jgi:hypothetical protein